MVILELEVIVTLYIQWQIQVFPNGVGGGGKTNNTFIDIAHMVHTLGTDHNLLHFSFKLKMLIQKVCRQRLHLVR